MAPAGAGSPSNVRPVTVRQGVAALALAGALASCGSDGDDPAPVTSTTVAAGQEAGTTTTAVGAEDKAIEIVVADGAVVGGVRRFGVKLGDEVVLRVTSDVADEIHVHGYDHRSNIAAGATAEVRFTADIPGVFEVEFERRAQKIVELEVAP